jgi:hypothetical protein
MDYDLAHGCEQHPDRNDCPDALIAEIRGGYGLIVHDGGDSVVTNAFCPWCGAKLLPVGDIDLSVS